MNDVEKDSKLLHLYRRAALGSIPDTNFPLNRAIKALLNDSKSFIPFDIVTAGADTGEMKQSKPTVMEPDLARKEKKRLEREQIRDLNVKWLDTMADGNDVFRERMALFWHGHFACRSQEPVFVQNYINTIRRHALGNFGEMLMAVSKEPAMLQFLNNQQNRKKNPNENFAREVMELFTLGRGHYNENDVKEGARAFTGWGYDPSGQFRFRERIHDEGQKNFLGKQGAFDGTDVISILLEQKQTARFVTEKIYRAFVSEIPDNERIQKLADDFYRSKYDIKRLMEKIFHSDWFYDSAAENVLIKSPVELLVGIRRTLSASFNNKQSELYIQKVLGQVLFYPPNVAGWSGGRNWIDSSSLMFRLQLPNLMIGDAQTTVKAKESGDVNDLSAQKQGKNIKAEVNWNAWAEKFERTDPAGLPLVIANLLLARQPGPDVMAMISKRASPEADRVQAIRKITLAIMSLPEYQVS